jgi:GAF domain-containing protein
MAPSFIFWTNMLINFGVSLSALTSLMLILGTGARRRLSQPFVLYAASVALVGVGSTLAGLSFWLDSRGMSSGEGLGAPLFWMKLAAIGVCFWGPSLFAFSSAYVEALCAEDGTRRGVGRSGKRAHRSIVLVGFAAAIGLVALVLIDQVMVQPGRSEVGVSHLAFTRLGYIAFLFSILYGLLALTLFGRNRHLLGARSLAVGTAVWLAVSITAVLARMELAVGALTLGGCVAIGAYAVLEFRVFNPLRTAAARLEEGVSKRTRELQRAKDQVQRQYEQQLSVAQISREIAQISDPNAMLARLVELIHNRLGYHHIYVFQPDRTNHYLVVKAAAGTTARTILESGYRLRIGGESLAGRVAAEHRPRIAGGKGDDTIYLGDPALPGARAEMAVPMVIGGEVLGVLDLQSIHYETFSEEDFVLLTTLADQAAVTLNKCRLLGETEAALAEVEKAQRQYVSRAWHSSLGGARIAPAFRYSDSEGVVPTHLRDACTPQISQAAMTHNMVDSNGDTAQAGVAIPITLRGQVIGALQLRRKSGRPWQPEELEAVKELTDRLGLALETARLSEEAQRHAAHQRFAAEITTRMQESLNIDSILRTAVKEIGGALNLSDITIQLKTDGEQKP